MGVFTVGRQVGLEIDMPGWWLANASVDMDFRNGRYYDSTTYPQSASGLLSCTRASIGYAKTAEGTLTQFASNALRITSAGLLVEDARTNLSTYSDDFSTTWGGSAVTVTSNDTTAPDGTTTADKLLSGSTSANIDHSGSGAVSLTGGIASTVSCYFKPSGTANTWILFRCEESGGANNFGSYFNLSGSGSLGSSLVGGDGSVAARSIEALANGWYRCIVTGQNTATRTMGLQTYITGAADGFAGSGSAVGDFVWAWGAQLEVGPSPSSYIPTTSASATRAADSISGIGNLVSVFSGVQASTVTDVIANAVPLFYWRIIGDATAGDRTALATDNASNTSVVTYTGSSLLAAGLGGSLTFTQGVKVGTSWNTATPIRSLVGGGGTVASDANAVGFPLLLIGSSPTSTETFYGYFRRITAWNSRLADATLQALTAP